jgi:hypothetical protein
MNWDQYFCEIDGSVASIVLDLDLREVDASELGRPYVLRVRVAMRDPREDGLSSDDEAQTLGAIEDALQTVLGEGAILAGRYTVTRHRTFVLYVDDPKLVDRVESAMREYFPEYRQTSFVKEDPHWETYHEFLYPGALSLRSMFNRRACDALLEDGDPLTDARRIRHRIVFDGGDPIGFVEQAGALGFEARGTDEEVVLWRVDLPSHDNIDALTHPLVKLAAEFGGEYEDWE